MGSRSRFVVPSTVRLPLSEGDWIEVHERLSYAESERLTMAAFKPITYTGGGVEPEMDWVSHRMLRIQTWLVDWSFLNGDGKSVPVTRENIERLDTDTADEINEALDAHIERQSQRSLDPPTASSAP